MGYELSCAWPGCGFIDLVLVFDGWANCLRLFVLHTSQKAVRHCLDGAENDAVVVLYCVISMVKAVHTYEIGLLRVEIETV